VPNPLPDLADYHAGPYGRGSQGEPVAPAELIEPFARAARGWRAEVLLAGEVDWPVVLRDALDRHGCAKVAIGAGSPLQPQLDAALRGLAVRRYDEVIEAWKHELFDSVDAGITAVDGAMADTGTLVLQPGAHEPRCLSLVPPVHVAVLRASQLHASLPAAMAALGVLARPGSAGGDLPTNLVLVTGPSKTSDIQQTLAYGAHGPKVLVIVLVDDVGTASADLGDAA
jgi:L-lactate dehydrogenase complex protein LldG